MLKFLRMCSVASMFCIGSLYANSHPCPGQWEISADYLLLKPTFDDTFFVIQSPISTGFPNGKRENNDFDFRSGFRVGGAYAFCECDREIEVSYTYFENKHNKTVNGDFLWATIGRPNLSALFENFPGSASSHLELLYQRGNALLAQQLFNCCGLDIYLQFGLDSAYLRLEENYAYVRPESFADIHQKSRTWGIGPQLGFELDYEIYQCPYLLPGTLSLTVLSSGSLLASETRTKEQNRVTGFTSLDVHDRNTWRTIPALHAKIGLNYDAPCSCYDVSLEVGYEFSSYFRALSRVEFPDDIATGLSYNNYYNFDIQGLYVSANVRF